MWLTRDGLREAKETAWDAETNRLISWEDQMLNEEGNERPIWSGTKTQITNLKDVLQEGKIEQPECTDWREDHVSTTSTFHYAKNSVASESTTGQAATEGRAKAAFAEGFNPAEDDEMTAVTMDSTLRSSDKSPIENFSPEMVEVLEYLASIQEDQRKHFTDIMKLAMQKGSVDAELSTCGP